jgi:two-component system response regulator PilR (NtrC family)
MTDSKILVIDDEPEICELLSMALTRMGLLCDVASNVKDALVSINTHKYFLVLTDMRLPDGDGYSIVQYIQTHKPQLPVAVITAFGHVEGAVNTLKAGAFDYVSKPVDLSVLKALVATALRMYKSAPKQNDNLLLGDSVLMLELRQHIQKLARSQAPVYIHGDSGVGKELVARLIHASGPRSHKPFVPVNCGAIPSELMESEFFGHKKGSFTGAISDKQGLFVAANGGTLFLDEVAELPLAMQVKLLRAIQEKAIKPVGEWHETPVDVRILSASNKNLLYEVTAGRFRQELYYRINVLYLSVPSLAQRAEDIPIIANHILEKLAHEQQRNPLKLAACALKSLQTYAFPGNIRELENILERAVALSNSDVIEQSDLHLPEEGHVLTASTRNQMQNLDNNLEEHEKELILDALEKTKWNRTAAARLLGLSFRTLRYRLKKLGID